jgi:hypothetical protein
MKTVYLVYQSDRWHSTASKVLFGVFKSKERAIKAVSKEDKSLDISDITALSCFDQTQNRDNNYLLVSTILQ